MESRKTSIEVASLALKIIPDAPPVTIATFPWNLFLAAVEGRPSSVSARARFEGGGEVAIFLGAGLVFQNHKTESSALH